MKDEIWRTKDGREIPVGQMSEEHAKNVLRLILQNRRANRARAEVIAQWIRPYLKAMDEAEDNRLAEEEQKMFDDIYNDVFGHDGQG